jgi:hypothetical protein
MGEASGGAAGGSGIAGFTVTSGQWSASIEAGDNVKVGEIRAATAAGETAWG